MTIKLFDVYYGDRLQRRGLVVEIFANHLVLITERGGVDYVNLPPSKWRLMDLAEWERFADHLAEDITGQELREAKENARASFVWPKEWQDFKTRHDATGNAFVDAPPEGTLNEWNSK